tara:strand:+ start:54440 stop:57706 length:3267 start_codon:yes stop_codon:yes gene_type:complete
MTDYYVQNSELLPKFAIKKVAISEKDMEIQAVLQRPRNLSYTNWIGSSEFSQYIKYYFIASPPLSPSGMADFYYPETRIASLSQAAGMANVYRLWHHALGDEGGKLQWWARFTTRPGYNPYKFFGWAAVSLDEIFQEEDFNKDPKQRKYGTEPLDSTALADPEGYNTSFNIRVPFNGDPLSSDIDGLNLMAFASIDLEGLHEDFDLPKSAIASFSKLSGPLLFEKCLIKDEENVSYQDFIVPAKRKAFFTPDGARYSGPVHEHTSDFPGPNGYIGYMSGPAFAERMSEAAKLQVREVKNTKIVSKFTQRALGHDGKPLTQKNTFSGYTFMSAQPTVSDTGPLAFGDTILRSLKAQLGQIIEFSQDNNQSQASEYLKRRAILSIKKDNFNPLSGTPKSWIGVNNSRSFHGSHMFIDVLDIVSTNSRFGYLIDAHREKYKTSRGSAEFSARLLNDFTDASTVRALVVNRERVTNSQLGNNSVSSPAYERYDQTELKREIIRTTADREVSGGRIIKEASNKKARIFQPPSSGNSGPLPRKSLIEVHDYDLFENYNTGKYRYVVDLTMEDGVLKTLKKHLKDFKKRLDAYSGYVKEAQRPFISQENSLFYSGYQFKTTVPPSSEVMRGNYDHSIQDFTLEFKERAQSQYLNVVNKVVRSYCVVYYLITAESIFSNFRKIDSIVESLLPKSTTVESLEFFENLCFKLYDKVKKLSTANTASSYDGQNFGNKKKSIKSGINFPDSLIMVSGVTTSQMSALSKNAVLFEPASEESSQISRIFTIDVITDILAKEEASNPEEGYIVNDDKLYRTQDLWETSPGRSNDPEILNRAHARIMAAIERSRTAPPTTPDPKEGVFNSINELNELLNSVGGTSLEGILSSTNLGFEGEPDNKDKERLDPISKDLQNSIINTIETSENQEIFIKQMENKYRDIELNSSTLGEAYDTIKSLISARNSTQSASYRANTYQERSTTRTSLASNRESRSMDVRNTVGELEGKQFETFTYDEQGVIIKSDTPGPFGVVIQEATANSLKGAQPVNNVRSSPSQENKPAGRRSRSSSSRPRVQSQTSVRPQIQSSPSTGASSGPKGGSGY